MWPGAKLVNFSYHTLIMNYVVSLLIMCLMFGLTCVWKLKVPERIQCCVDIIECISVRSIAIIVETSRKQLYMNMKFNRNCKTKFEEKRVPISFT